MPPPPAAELSEELLQLAQAPPLHSSSHPPSHATHATHATHPSNPSAHSSTHPPSVPRSLAQAYALFEQLSVGIDAAVAVHERLLRALQPAGAAAPPTLLGAGSREHEALLEHLGWLLARHAAAHPAPPARLQQMLARGLAAFPANAALLAAFVGGRLSAHRRLAVRRELGSLRRAHPACLQLWAASISLELAGDTPLGDGDGGGGGGGGGGPSGDHHNAVSALTGGVRRARALYEAALHPAACGGCAALWRGYLSLEVRCGRREAACRVLLRAVQLCPGAKALWCDALRPPLLGWLSDQQLQDMRQLVGEKELRLRHDLPEPEELLQAAAPPPDASEG